MDVSSRSRYTSPLHAGARFVAQRGILRPVIWRLATITVLGRERVEKVKGPFVVVSNHTSPASCRAMSRPVRRLTTSSTCGGAKA
jgi:1-acyl-sn-glycerol-3-phosphate acyltransferase